ncbi:hypothetical protein MUO65_05890, partial [bacterium]|nr:hypothetical protein [bacterium]
MSLLNFLPPVSGEEIPQTTNNSAADNSATSGWDALRSRISRYRLVSKEFPQWDEEREEILPSKCYLSGEVVHHPKEPGKMEFRVNRQWLVRIPRENEVLQVDDCVDFRTEDEAIDFMLQEKEHLDFLSEHNVLEHNKYFWSIKDDKPYMKYLG